MAVGAYATAKLLGETATGPPLAVALVRRPRWPARRRRARRARRPRGCAGRTWRARRSRWPSGCPRSRSASRSFLGGVERADDDRRRRRRWRSGRRSRSSAGRRGSPAWPRWSPTSLLANLVRSGFGRAFRAVRDDEVAAQLAGYNVARTQVLAFVVSSACAGLAGGLLVVVTAAGRARRVPARAVGRAAHRRDPRRARQPAPARSGSAALLVLIPTWSDDLSKALSLSDNVQANLALAIYGARADRRDARGAAGSGAGACAAGAGILEGATRGEEPRKGRVS